ncbi:nose resistant to fluoxetine protein 6-like [Daktulosphaira vitifoliae]|uniref:nose resistant to fluoxetine protein 6-like n=1 Tax=Daktulosphaira vitifoliae TaxID=58002 RepID=UPI0021A9F327|nr:nose resistant to fluoxetine protein 6-like [Daktulosphaira vitifoliae]
MMILLVSIKLSILYLLTSKVLSQSLRQNENESLIVKFEDASSKINTKNYVFPPSQPADLFYKAFTNLTLDQTNSSLCRIQSDLYIRHLKNNSLWAVKMSDSWYKYSSGMFSGSLYQMGVYDECIDIQYPLQGQYCIANIKLSSALTNENYSLKAFENLQDWDNAWNKIFGWIDYKDQLPRNLVKFGMCIPASCSAADLEKSLQIKLDEIFLPEQVKTAATVNPLLCSIKDDMYPFTNGYYVTCAVFCFMFLICCCATFYHYKNIFKLEGTERIENDGIYLAFSIIKNGKNLLAYNKNNELNFINGLKVLLMAVILLAHRLFHLVGLPLNYPEIFESIYVAGFPSLLTGQNIIDPFFFMTGFLTYIVLYPVFTSKAPLWKKIIMPLIYRVVRMLPSYIAVMAFTAQILPHFGNGPFWKQKTWYEADICRDNWWTNILFISNFIDVKYQCLITSWYISCDLQYYMICIILGYTYTKSKKFGLAVLGFFLVVSLGLPFYITYTQNLNGLLKIDVPFLSNPRSSVLYNKIYTPVYFRAIPFLTGLATSFLLEKLKETKFKMSYTLVYIGTLVVTTVSMLAQFYGVKFYERNRPYSAIENALYASIFHCTWPLILSWIIISQLTTGYGPLIKLLSNRFVVPLGRLSYCVYLVNLIVMIISTGSERTVTHSSFNNLINAWIYDSIKSYLFAAILYLIIDEPFSHFIRIAFGRQKKPVALKIDGTQNENLPLN